MISYSVIFSDINDLSSEFLRYQFWIIFNEVYSNLLNYTGFESVVSNEYSGEMVVEADKEDTESPKN